MNVLVIEPVEQEAAALKRHLNQGRERYELTVVPRTEAALAYLRQPAHRVDVVISAETIPAHDAQSPLARQLRDIMADVPFIFSSAQSDPRLIDIALQNGAQDYLVKGTFSDEDIRRSIRYAVERKKMQDANQAKDDFISLASHQLRTPATGVKQYLGLVLEGYAGDIDPRQAEFLQLAYESNERQLKIISDLLRTAQLDAGRITLDTRPVNLPALLRNIVNEQSVKLRARDQVVRLDLPDCCGQVRADPGKLRMALENLLDNASKYTPQGKTIHIGLAAGKKSCRVTLRDEGVGIDPRDMDKLFRKFSRISNDLSDQVGGSGLGLYWVKNIVDLHGGTISVSSTPGKGTSFVIKLPYTS